MNWNISDYAAWYAAVVATVIFIWDIIKWVKGGKPKLKFSFLQGINEEEEYPHLRVKIAWSMKIMISNIGEQKTTVTNISFEYYNNLWNVLFKRKPINPPIEAGQFQDNEINPGETHFWFFKGNKDLISMLADGHLYALIDHSFGRKPIKTKIKNIN